jgi:hypothetical protein
LAQLILPGYRALSGDRCADDFARDAANRAEGPNSKNSRPATDLARETLSQAQLLLDEGAFTRVLTLFETNDLDQRDCFLTCAANVLLDTPARTERSNGASRNRRDEKIPVSTAPVDACVGCLIRSDTQP